MILVKNLSAYRIVLILITIICMWLLSFLQVQRVNAITGTINGWHLNQNSNFAGGISSHITKEVLKIDLKDLKLIIIVKAPKWNSSIYNLKTHEYFNLSYKELLKLLGTFRNNKVEEDKYIIYETKLANSTLKIAGLRTIDGTIRRKDSRNKEKLCKVAEFWMAPDIRIPKNIIAIFSRLVGLNNLSGMPVKYCRYRGDEKVVLFDTLSVKNISMQDSDLKSPSNFKNGGGVNKLFNQILGSALSSIDDEDVIPKSHP